MIDPLAAGARLAGSSALTALALAAIGYFPTLQLAGAGSETAMAAGIGVALLGAWAGCALPVIFLNRAPQLVAYATLGGLGLRFAVTLALALALRQAGFQPAKAMLIWVGLAQLVVLLVDTIGLARLVSRIKAAETV